MKRPRRLSSLYVSLAFLMILGFGAAAHAEWHFGIGTGFAGQTYDGDLGVTTNVLGPVLVDVDLSAEDVSDLMATAFGLGGYATDGTWKIMFSAGFLKLEDEPAYSDPGVWTVTSDLSFEKTNGELTVGYAVYKNPSAIVHVLAGARYTKHEAESAITVTYPTDPAELLEWEAEEEWVDAVIGLTLDVPFAQTWSWSSRIDAGFGGSEGTFGGSTGLTWAFAEHWAGMLTVGFMAVDYENGDRGDADWYKYDINEGAGGIKILYRW